MHYGFFFLYLANTVMSGGSLAPLALQSDALPTAAFSNMTFEFQADFAGKVLCEHEGLRMKWGYVHI